MNDLKSEIFLGFVVDNQDPDRLGRCKVRVLNIFDHIEPDGSFSIPTSDVPWATPWKDLNGNSFNLPEVGKIVSVVFEGGDPYKPEYIWAEHYNGCLEEKLKALSSDDYGSMKALLFDYQTQIYVNDSEGLKMDYHFNNINIKDKSINLNLKDNNAGLNLGSAGAAQQAILGNHFMDWFQELMTIMATSQAFTSTGAPGPVPPSPRLVKHITKFNTLKDKKFLSRHVRIVDNNQVTTVKNTGNSFPVHRENLGIAGDFWKIFNKINIFAIKLPDLPLPSGFKKKRYDAKYKSPQEKNPLVKPSDSQVTNPNNPDNSKQNDGLFNDQVSSATTKDYSRIDPNKTIEFYEDDDDIAKVVRYLESKTGKSPVTGREEDYQVYEDPYVLNIIAFRNKFHEYGTVTNSFDDELWVFFKNEKDQWETIRKFTVTTVPGYKVVDGKVVDPPVLPDGASFINYGQYINSYKLGYHSPDDYGNRHPALICDKVGIRINKKRGVFERQRYVNTVTLTQFGPDVDGWVYGTGMNIHCAMSIDESVLGTNKYPQADTVYEEVNNWSMGCIVFNNPEQYREFIGLCDEQRIKGKKSQFTVTVASTREFDIFETGEDIGFDQTQTLNDDITERFPDIQNEED